MIRGSHEIRQISSALLREARVLTMNYHKVHGLNPKSGKSTDRLGSLIGC